MTTATTTSSVKAEANTVELGLASITASASATSIQQDISVPEPLEQVHVEFIDPGGQSTVTDALPDTGANITAMPASQAVKFKPLRMR